MKKLLVSLDAIERLLKANAELRISTLDESLTAARKVERLRHLVASGADPEAVRLAMEVTMAATGPCIREGLTVKGRLSQALVTQARARLGPTATQEDLAAELGVDGRTLRNWFSHFRRLKRIPAKRGRPKSTNK